jgi:mRNA interferase MazF
VAGEVARGDIWLYRFQPPDKRRPVLVLTRDDAIGLLRTVLVAPITSTIRGSPGEVVLGVDVGLKHQSAANLDRVQCVERSRLVRYVGHVDPRKMRAVCRALSIATGCSS